MAQNPENADFLICSQLGGCELGKVETGFPRFFAVLG
jgi:hypothetical protein